MSTFRERRPDVRQEPDCVDVKAVLGIGFAVIAFGFALAIWAYALLKSTEQSLRPSGVFPEKHLVKPEEVSQVRQGVFKGDAAAERYERPLRAELESWGWVDAEKKQVRIPIDVAMKLVAEGR